MNTFDNQTLETPREWSTGSGLIELTIAQDDASSGSHQGACDEDIEQLARFPYIAAQLEELDEELVAAELSEYGAWDDAELADHQQNLQRLLWLACCDIMEEVPA